MSPTSRPSHATSNAVADVRKRAGQIQLSLRCRFYKSVKNLTSQADLTTLSFTMVRLSQLARMGLKFFFTSQSTVRSFFTSRTNLLSNAAFTVMLVRPGPIFGNLGAPPKPIPKPKEKARPAADAAAIAARGFLRLERELPFPGLPEARKQ